MSSKTLRKRLRRAINRHVAAQISQSWAGGAHPDDRPIIEKEAKLARQNLDRVIGELVALAADFEVN